MPQEFQVICCYSCSTFQVHQVKKSNKWNCKMCNEKQSLKKVFGLGTGADCRKHVQKLNAKQGQMREDDVLPVSASHSLLHVPADEIEPQPALQTPDLLSEPSNNNCNGKGSKWSMFTEKSSDEEPEDCIYQPVTNVDIPELSFRSRGYKKRRTYQKKRKNYDSSEYCEDNQSNVGNIPECNSQNTKYLRPADRTSYSSRFNIVPSSNLKSAENYGSQTQFERGTHFQSECEGQTQVQNNSKRESKSESQTQDQNESKCQTPFQSERQIYIQSESNDNAAENDYQNEGHNTGSYVSLKNIKRNVVAMGNNKNSTVKNNSASSKWAQFVNVDTEENDDEDDIHVDNTNYTEDAKRSVGKNFNLKKGGNFNLDEGNREEKGKANFPLFSLGPDENLDDLFEDF